MPPKKKKIKDLEVAFSNAPSIEELLANDDASPLSYTSPLANKTIELKVFRFSGKDILEKTNVHPKNKRIQVYQTALSLAPLITSLQRNNQVSPALGRIEDDGSITAIYGSRRRLASYFGETEYVILASKDLTDDIAEEISDAENISENISLIERGHIWLEINNKEGLSSRDISVQFENSKVSHTIIAAGINGAKLPEDLIKLFPSTNIIGLKTIGKLTNAIKARKVEDILAFVTEELSEITTNLWDAFRDENDVLTQDLSTKLSNAIVAFATPVVKKKEKAVKALSTNKKVSTGVNAKVNTKGRMEYVTFDENLSTEKMDKVISFLESL